MKVVSVNTQNFDVVTNSEKPVFLDFYADWCGPCRTMAHIVDKIAEERTDILVGKVNVADEPELARRFQVVSVPTFAVLENGKVVERVTGVHSKSSLLSILTRHV